MMGSHPVVVGAVFPFELHGPHSHAEPLVQFAELPADVGPGGGEVVGHSPHCLVDLLHDHGIQVVGADGEFRDPGLEFLDRLAAHLHGPGPHAKAEELKALDEAGEPGLLGAQAEPDAGEMFRDKPVGLPGLVR